MLFNEENVEPLVTGVTYYRLQLWIGLDIVFIDYFEVYFQLPVIVQLHYWYSLPNMPSIVNSKFISN